MNRHISSSVNNTRTWVYFYLLGWAINRALLKAHLALLTAAIVWATFLSHCLVRASKSRNRKGLDLLTFLDQGKNKRITLTKKGADLWEAIKV